MMDIVALPSGNHQSNVDRSGEEDPLLKKTPFEQLRRRYRNTRKCVSSKAAILVLVWSYTVSLVFFVLLNLCSLENVPRLLRVRYFLIAASVFPSILFFFYPLAGYLADNRFGRYKTILTSLRMLLLALVLALIGGGALAVALMISIDELGFGILILVAGLGLVCALVALALMMVCFVGFNANVIQFGLDQLHDSPGEDQSLFIHWYIWTYNAALYTEHFIISSLEVSHPGMQGVPFFLLGLIVALASLLLIVSLCVVRRRRRWFLIDPSRLNPYRLVHQVSKFARQHKVPVHRSAFTYCEDEVPSGLDIGKDKYGGPFTTEQVEDVKAFYGILKVLFSLGPVFFVDVSVYGALSLYSIHISNPTCPISDMINATILNTATDPSQAVRWLLVDNGMLSPLLIVLCIPLHLFLILPVFFRYIPGMLKRIGIGIVLTLLSLLSTLILETMTHVENEHLGCMFDDNDSYPRLSNSSTLFCEHSVDYYRHILNLQYVLSAFSHMVISIALYEFICSQSPHSMKGLIIGISFAIRGAFEFLATTFVIPFAYGFHAVSLPSCGMVYYLVNMCVCVCTVLVYMCVARRYKCRERDEPCHVHRYVEEYYSNFLQEKDY